MSKCVLVTGIGGNVAQGILRNISSFHYDIRLVGTNTEQVSGGNHLCDQTYKVPFSSASNYISTISRICNKEKVDLIIPSTDYEVYYLALAKKMLPVIACSDQKIALIFLNKYKTWSEFKKHSIPFAETKLPSEFKGEFGQFIVKPIEGRGSRELYTNPKNPKSFSDNFVIQKLYTGKEITSSFYVTKERRLLGQITFERTLINGTTNMCEVSFKYNREVIRIIQKIKDTFEIYGSCNMQSIVTAGGRIIPFEINCRISGTNSIRGQLGFEDVRYTIDEYLYNKVPKKPKIKKGAAVRILMDVIYPGIALKDVKNRSTKHHVF